MPISGGPIGGDQAGVPLRLTSNGPDRPYWIGVGVSIIVHGCVLAYALNYSLLSVPGASQTSSSPISIELVDTKVFEARARGEREEAASSASAVAGDTAEETKVAAASNDRHPTNVSSTEPAGTPADAAVKADSAKVEPAPEPAGDTQQTTPPVAQPLPLVTPPQPQEAEQPTQKQEEAVPQEEKAPEKPLDAVKAPEAVDEKKPEETKPEEKPAVDASEQQAPAEPQHKADERRKERRKGRGTTTSIASAGSGQNSASAGQVSASRGQVLAYKDRVYAHLRANKPMGVMGRGTAIVAISLSTTGRLIAAHVSRSSQIPDWDRAALRAVRSASPYPRPPASMTASQLHFSVPFILD